MKAPRVKKGLWLAHRQRNMDRNWKPPLEKRVKEKKRHKGN